MCGDKHVFLKNGSDLFLRDDLEAGYRFDGIFEIRFSARVLLACEAPARRRILRSDLPDGQITSSVIPGRDNVASFDVQLHIRESITTGRRCWLAG
jgi:hypothetical protein